MVLTDTDIWKEIKKKRGHHFIITPTDLLEDQIKTFTIDLRVDFRFVKLRFKKQEDASGIENRSTIILDKVPSYDAVEKSHGDVVTLESGQRFHLEAEGSILAWTYEKIVIPPHLAARIEGKSTWARLGLTIHNTAPTIHPGFGYSREGKPVGKQVCLEVANLNKDADIEITPCSRECYLSQLILESVKSPPKVSYSQKGQFVPT